MIDRILGWLKRRSDKAQVTYSRFGIPGDEVDERAPPTHIHVAHFDDNAPQYRAFFIHSRRVAAISASIGLACSLFVLLVFLFNVTIRHDMNRIIFIIGRFLIVLTILSIPVAIHWQALVGIKKEKAMHFVPVIMVYSFTLVAELIVFLLAANHILLMADLFPRHSPYPWRTPAIYLIIMGVQAVMLISFHRARSYYEHKEIHRMEVRVAEQGKIENPQMEIVYVKETDQVDPMPISDVPLVTSSPRLRVILSANDEIS